MKVLKILFKTILGTAVVYTVISLGIVGILIFAHSRYLNDGGIKD